MGASKQQAEGHLDDFLDDVAVVVAHIAGVHLYVEIAGIGRQLNLQGAAGQLLQQPTRSAYLAFRDESSSGIVIAHITQRCTTSPGGKVHPLLLGCHIELLQDESPGFSMAWSPLSPAAVRLQGNV